MSAADVDEPTDDEDRRGEAERGVAVRGSAVGVAAKLAVVRPPRVGRFDDPSQSETERLLLHAGNLGSSQLDLELAEPGGAETISYRTGVIDSVEVQGADIGEQAGVGDRIEGGFEHAHVVAVGAVDRPADPDAV